MSLAADLAGASNAGAQATAPADTQTANALAARVAAGMLARDTATKDTMQMRLLVCESGRAVFEMPVRALHLNGHGICHGGFIFTLADSTFAFACNSRNQATVAAGCSIEFLRAAHLGDVLTCEGVEQHVSGRHGIYDMRVTNQNGEVVALFRGKSAQIKGTVIPEQDDTA